MRARLAPLGLLVVLALVMLSSPGLASDLSGFAPGVLSPAGNGVPGYAALMYLSGIDSPTGQPVTYPRASDEEMQWLLRLFHSNDGRTRAIAIGALGQSNNPQATDTVIAALHDPQYGVQLVAQMVIGVMNNPKAIEANRQLELTQEKARAAEPQKKPMTYPRPDWMHKPEPRPVLDANTVRKYAAEIRAVRANDYDGYGRVSGYASQLAMTTNPLGVAALMRIANERTNPTAARIAASALIAVSGNPKVRSLLIAILRNRKHYAYRTLFDALAQRQDVAAMAGFLHSNDPREVREALWAVRDSRQMVPQLIAFLKNPHYQYEAAMALARQSNPAALDTLVGLLRTHDGDELIKALMQYGKPATDRVRVKLSSKDPKMSAGAAAYFASVKDQRAVDGLIACTRNKDKFVRRKAIEALIYQEDEKADPIYVEALKDSDGAVRKAAVWMVMMSPTPSATKALVPLVKDDDLDIRTCAAIALGELGDGRGVGLILDYYDDLDKYTDIMLDDMHDYHELLSLRRASFNKLGRMTLPAARAVARLKEKRAIGAIIKSLAGEAGGTSPLFVQSREAKLAALRATTGQDFGYAFYRWMAWWVAQGHEPPAL